MITISNCGHDSQHRIPCNIEHNHGLPNYLMLLVKKEAWIIINGERIVTKPNMLIIFPPHSYIHYGCDTAGYNDDWIHFSIAEEDTAFFNDLHIPMSQPIYPYNFHLLTDYIQLVTQIHHDHDSDSSQKQSIHHLFISFFLCLKMELQRRDDLRYSNKYYMSFSQLRTQIYNTPSNNWNIADIASSLYLSTSYFQHTYKQLFHCSCQQDIIHARINLAKFYLKTSTTSIAKLAEFCGYENELHFMRQFKKITNLTPSEFRKNSQSEETIPLNIIKPQDEIL